MESRASERRERQLARPAISRRSCDQCRVRKIGCDRGSPCSNCISARVDCTHSAVSSSSTGPKQRVLISSQYEQKIDAIAHDIGGIKQLLQDFSLPSGSKATQTSLEKSNNEPESSTEPPSSFITSTTQKQPVVEAPCATEPRWTHSSHITDFIKSLLEAGGGQNKPYRESEGIMSSLKMFLQTLEKPAPVPYPTTPISAEESPSSASGFVMPALDEAVMILRWAKEHADYPRLVWISQILPLTNFTDICRKVYFAVDNYTETEYLLANGYLSYVFAEHFIATGDHRSGEYCRMCRTNLHRTLARMPFLMPATMESIAALALGSFHTTENSKVAMGWRFVSAAADLCQTLGYHRARPVRDGEHDLRSAQTRLFWVVYRMEKGLSLRLARPSNIHDSEITLPPDPSEPRFVRQAKIQGKVYAQLYSPTGLARRDKERGEVAEQLAVELRGLIGQTHAEILDCESRYGTSAVDQSRTINLYCDLVCQSSLLVLILRAVPASPGSRGGVSNDCLAVARDTLDLHDQCMKRVRQFKVDPFIITAYINWAILHTPFVPFSILFTRTIQVVDFTDLDRLERFAASLQPEAGAESITHPHRLYELLCQAARLYLESSAALTLTDESDVGASAPSYSNDVDFANIGMETDGGWMSSESQNMDLSDWYQGNQEILRMLDMDITF